MQTFLEKNLISLIFLIEKIPSYEDDPKKLMDRYKKCSILTYDKITYSNSTVEDTRNLPVGKEN